MSASRRQRGVMLLELLTGLAIGMMVTLAAIGTLAFVQASATVQNDAFLVQQRVDVALQTIGAQVRQAGAIELQASVNGTVRFSSAFNGHAGGGFPVLGEEGSAGAPDILRTSYQDDGDARDCLGNQPDAAQSGVRVDSRFALAKDALRCLGAHAASGNQVIVDGVEDFQVLYGVRAITATGPQFHFVDANAVAGRWGDVGAVRVCLQVRGDAHHPQAGSTPDCHGTAVASDGRLRRVTHATFNLPNAPL